MYRQTPYSKRSPVPKEMVKLRLRVIMMDKNLHLRKQVTKWSLKQVKPGFTNYQPRGLPKRKVKYPKILSYVKNIN